MRRAIKVAPGSPWANDIIGYSVQSFGMGGRDGGSVSSLKDTAYVKPPLKLEPSNLLKKKIKPCPVT